MPVPRDYKRPFCNLFTAACFSPILALQHFTPSRCSRGRVRLRRSRTLTLPFFPLRFVPDVSGSAKCRRERHAPSHKWQQQWQQQQPRVVQQPPREPRPPSGQPKQLGPSVPLWRHPGHYLFGLSSVKTALVGLAGGEIRGLVLLYFCLEMQTSCLSFFCREKKNIKTCTENKTIFSVVLLYINRRWFDW